MQTMLLSSRFTVLVVTCSLLAACADRGPKEQAGTVIGGIAGAAVGSLFGKGSGRNVAIAAGTLLGAMAGSEVGRSLDKADRAYLAQANDKATDAPIGETIHWNNPQTGHYGTVTPVRDGTQAQTGAYCREFQQTVTIGGKTEQAYGTACRQPDGSWRIVSTQ